MEKPAAEKTGVDWVDEEDKKVLKEGFSRTWTRDISLSKALYNALETIVKCIPVSNDKSLDYQIAAALCKHYGYLVNGDLPLEFKEYYSKNEPSKEDAERRLKGYLGIKQ